VVISALFRLVPRALVRAVMPPASVIFVVAVFGACATVPQAESTRRTAVLEFLDIPCPGHVATLLEAARLTPGVENAEVDFDTSRGTFVYNSEQTNPEAIIAALPPDCPAVPRHDGPATDPSP